MKEITVLKRKLRLSEKILYLFIFLFSLSRTIAAHYANQTLEPFVGVFVVFFAFGSFLMLFVAWYYEKKEKRMAKNQKLTITAESVLYYSLVLFLISLLFYHSDDYISFIFPALFLAGFGGA